MRLVTTGTKREVSLSDADRKAITACAEPVLTLASAYRSALDGKWGAGVLAKVTVKEVIEKLAEYHVWHAREFAPALPRAAAGQGGVTQHG